MQRFFVPMSQISETHVRIIGTDYGHIRHVLRMKPGESFVVSLRQEEAEQTGYNANPERAFNGEYYCVLEEFTEREVIARIAYHQVSKQELPCEITLFQGLPKGDKMELIIQKAVELGATRIVPVVMKRSIMKLEPAKAQKKVERWQAIAESASKQSGRGLIPTVTLPMSFAQAVRESEKLDVCMLPYEHAKGMKEARKLVEQIVPGQSVGIFIGPEGGFDDEEIVLAQNSGCQTMTLGKRILRTETAGLCILSVLMFRLTD